MLEILPLSRKEHRKDLVSRASEILKFCDTPDEFIGWLSVTAKSESISTFDTIQVAIEMGPEIFEKFSPEKWE